MYKSIDYLESDGVLSFILSYRGKTAVSGRTVVVETLESRQLLTVTVASWAQAFVNSIGINAGDASVSTINTLTSEIGIENIRGAVPGANDPGIVMVHPYADDSGYLDTSLSAIDAQLASIESTYTRSEVEAVEGPDEYDSQITYHSGDDPNWPATLRLFDQEMQQQMRANPWFDGIPYIGTSVAYDWSYPSVGNESAFVDGGNAHDYPGTANPQPALENWITEDSGYVTGGLPVWSTETGYSTGTGSDQVDDTVQARYYPRLFLDSFNDGYYKTFAYDLVDTGTDGTYNDSLGIVENDGVTLKPAAVALENLISILRDPQSNTFYAGGLDYALSGNTTNVDTTLLEKANGTFYLCLWQETPSTDDLAPAENVTLQFNTPVNSTVYEYLPNVSATGTAASLTNGAVTVGVTDQVTIIQITPTTIPSAPPAPANVEVVSAGSATRASITWSSVNSAQGYLIQRLNADDNWYTIGTTAATATAFTDSTVIPGDSYSYRVIAVNGGGGALSPQLAYTAPMANMVDDTLANFSLTTGNDGNWTISAGDGGTNFSPFVASHPNVSSDSLIYNYQGITDFQATVYLKNNWADTDATFFVSSNGSAWTPVNVNYIATATVPGYGYNVVFASPTAALPGGANYLKVTLAAGTGWPDGYIGLGNMDVTYALPIEQVNLSSAYNRTGIYTDESTFDAGAGLDGAGDALSFQQLNGWTVDWKQASFALGTASVKNVVSASGQTIGLTSGRYTNLELLAVGVDGNQTNQTFTVNYTDGTHQTFTQNLSSWTSPQNYSGESTVASMTYYDQYGGNDQTADCYVYGYTFALNSSKTVQSITLPNDPNVIVLAADLRVVAAPETATKLVFTQEPSGAVAGTALQPVVVAVEDQYGNIQYDDDSTIVLNPGNGPAGAGFSGNSTTSAKVSDGVAIFSSLVLDTAGNYTVVAADSSDGIGNFASSGFVVTPAAASRLVFTVPPGGAVVASPWAPIAVAIEDQFGNIETGDDSSISVSIGSGPEAAALGGTLTEQAVNGAAAFDGLTVDMPGNYALAASDGADNLSGFNSAGFAIANPPGVSTLGGAQYTLSGPAGAPVLDCLTGTVTLTSGFSAALPNATIEIQNGANVTLAANQNIAGLQLMENAVFDVEYYTVLINYGSNSDPISTLAGYIRSGFNGGGWNGAGIISSAAQTTNQGLHYGVGYADFADPYNPADLSAGQIKLMYTLLGDANLDGVVNGSDFSIVAANFGQGLTNWDEGNFLFTSAVNGSDFSALAVNFGQGDSGPEITSTSNVSVASNVTSASSTVPVVTTATAAPVTTPSTTPKPTAPISQLSGVTTQKSKKTPARNYAAAVVANPTSNLTTPTNSANQDTKFLADK